jgi:hypothetical protein
VLLTVVISVTLIVNCELRKIYKEAIGEFPSSVCRTGGWRTRTLILVGICPENRDL